MNCKPGDLAYIKAMHEKWAEGRIVRCLSLEYFFGTPCWNYEPKLTDPEGNVRKLIVDSCLRPIDNPGDDAVDEVIQRIGTPHKEVA